MTQPALPTLATIERGHWFAPNYDGGREAFDIKTAEWTHLCSARFGDGRPCGSSPTLWSGDSYRYDIFQESFSMVTPRLAMRWWNGGGKGWLICSDDRASGQSSPLLEIGAMTDEGKRWDYCHFLWMGVYMTALAATKSENRRMSQAFLEKRLKRKQREHKVYVEVIPATKKESSHVAD